ncbi:MAG0490 family ComEA-like DNA-binding protein [Mycoplasma tauri]|nr:hypothetical protein [Mycoplasma tauri]MBZ4212794.1 hypothetical protein [Mycoplasma tauri]MBZ4218483.1 hypothetical protein [Mycoplasma tauri]
MMKKWLIGSVLAFGIIGVSSTIAWKKHSVEINRISNENNSLIMIEVKGAVLFPGKHYFKKGVSFKQIIDKVRIDGADISKFDVNKKFDKNEKIFIPFLKFSEPKRKIEWKTLSSPQELINVGLHKKYAEKLYELRKVKHIVTWEDIMKIKGIGQKTIKRIQEVLII